MILRPTGLVAPASSLTRARTARRSAPSKSYGSPVAADQHRLDCPQLVIGIQLQVLGYAPEAMLSAPMFSHSRVPGSISTPNTSTVSALIVPLLFRS